MWSVIQHRYIKDSDQNNRPNVVWTGGRYKEACGQAKMNINSHLEMVMVSHNHFPFADVEIDMDNYSAHFFEGGVLVYSIRYEIVEIEDV
jgi:hypothetical protein